MLIRGTATLLSLALAGVCAAQSRGGRATYGGGPPAGEVNQRREANPFAQPLDLSKGPAARRPLNPLDPANEVPLPVRRILRFSARASLLPEFDETPLRNARRAAVDFRAGNPAVAAFAVDQAEVFNFADFEDLFAGRAKRMTVRGPARWGDAYRKAITEAEGQGGNPQALERIAALNLALGNAEEAEQAADRAIRISPPGQRRGRVWQGAPPETYNLRGVARLLLGKPAEAAEDFEVAIRGNARSDYKVNYGVALAAARRFDEADRVLAPYQAGVRPRGFLPPSGFGWLNIAGVRVVRGQFEEARGAYNEATRLLVNRDPSLHAKALLGVATTWLKEGRFRAAGRTLEGAVQIDPQNAVALHLRGIAHHQLGHRVPALRDYNNALKIDPDYVDVYLNRGALQAERGRVERSAADFAKYAATNPNDWALLANRALAAMHLNRPEEMRSAGAELAASAPERVAELQSVLAAWREDGNANARQDPAPQPSIEAALNAWDVARRNGDSRAMADLLGGPVGAEMRQLYRELEGADQAHRRLVAEIDARWGGFSVPNQSSPWDPQVLAAALPKRIEMVESRTILDRREGDRFTVFTAKSVVVDGDGVDRIRTEQFVAFQEEGGWRLLNAATANLNDAAQAIVVRWFREKRKRVADLHAEFLSWSEKLSGEEDFDQSVVTLHLTQSLQAFSKDMMRLPPEVDPNNLNQALGQLAENFARQVLASSSRLGWGWSPYWQPGQLLQPNGPAPNQSFGPNSGNPRFP